MPPKPSKWMINKTNLALPGNKGFHSGNFSPGNHFHRGHSSWHAGSFSAPLQSCASGDCQRCRPTPSWSRRAQILHCPRLDEFPSCKALALWRSTPRPRHSRIDRPVTQRGWLFGFAGAMGKPRSSPQQAPLEPWAGSGDPLSTHRPTQSKQDSQLAGKKEEKKKSKTKARERARGIRMKMLK